MRPVNRDTQYGMFVGLDKYTDKGYYEWINKKAKEFVDADIELEEKDDYINWLEGAATESTNPVEQDRLRDIVIAKRMIDEKIYSENYNGEYVGYQGYWDTWEGAIDNARQEKNQSQKPISIRGLDRDLYQKARRQAVREGKNIGQWLNIAIEDRLTYSAVDGSERKKNNLAQK